MNTTSASKTATTHGAYSAQVVLDWESESEFNELHKALVEELNPVGRDEEEIVFDLASLRWKKRRLNFSSQLAFRRIPDAHKLTDAARKGGWEAIAEHLAPSAQNADSLRAQVSDMVNDCAGASAEISNRIAKLAQTIGPAPSDAAQGSVPTGATEPTSKTSLDEMERLAVLLQVFQTSTSELNAALLRLEDTNGRLCELAYHPEILERDLKLHAMIDKQMEKTMVRLVSAKEFKRMYCPKVVSSSSPAGKTETPNQLSP